jgi:hypothetical protein
MLGREVAVLVDGRWARGHEVTWNLTPAARTCTGESRKRPFAPMPLMR